MAHDLARLRNLAFIQQSGLCYYCQQPMWQKDIASFALEHSVTLAQARRLQCTAEHMIAKVDGGGTNRKNIVAACTFCNSRRHRRTIAPAPAPYRNLVQCRVRAGRWHGFLRKSLEQERVPIRG